MTRILITAVVGGALSWALGQLLLPMLHALKAGASILEIGPSWHKSKNGTPIMGGLMFILASTVCLLGNLPAMTDSLCWRWLCASASSAFWMTSPRCVIIRIWA